MHPQNGNSTTRWQGNIRKPQKPTIQPKKSAFRGLNSADRRYSFDETKFMNKYRKNRAIGGMFANAKSSIPANSGNSSFQNSSSTFDDEDDPEATIPPPLKITKFSDFLRQNTRNGWDFSDISSGKEKMQSFHEKHEKQFPVIPQMKKLNSEDEKQPESASISTKIAENPPKFPPLPWLKKWNSEDEKGAEKSKNISEIPKNVDNGLEKTIGRFSKLFDNPEILRPIPLQTHTETTIGTVEKAVMAVALAQKDSAPSSDQKSSLPVYDLILKRSDWLLYREDLNDETDYEPDDPFFESELISSEFEQYEREMELQNIPTYIRKSDSEDDESTEKSGENAIFCEKNPEKFQFFEESDNGDKNDKKDEMDNLDSQEDDFFNVFSKPPNPIAKPNFPPKNLKNPPKIGVFNGFETPNFPKIPRKNFDFFLDFPDEKLGNSKNSKNPQNSGPCSSNYSPFDFSFFSQKSPRDPKSSNQCSLRNSKFSFC